ncbi:transcription elongation factor GreA [bacterium]|nr:transcription elongation factor GreA [bacterium]
MAQISYLSKEGYDKIQKEIEYLIKVKRKEITKTIAHAREFGDIKENAEYNAAKEAQAMNEIRISELRDKLATARIIDDLDIPSDKVYIGATVILLDQDSGEEIKYTLVPESEADILEDKISVSSPIGKGLLGHAENEVVEIEIPAGKIVYKIIKITRD